MLQPAGINPYKLVYKVTNGAVPSPSALRGKEENHGLLTPKLCVFHSACGAFVHTSSTTLKRMGLAMALMVLSPLCTFFMDLVRSSLHENRRCQQHVKIFRFMKFNLVILNSFPEEYIISSLFRASSQHVAIYVFICAQSSYSGIVPRNLLLHKEPFPSFLWFPLGRVLIKLWEGFLPDEHCDRALCNGGVLLCV